MSLIGNVLKPLATSILTLIRLPVTTWATDAAIHKKFGSGVTTLIISNKEMNDMKIVKSIEESGLLMKLVSKKWGKRTKRRIYRNINNHFRC